ncbi:hypothetical protein P7228_06465 [Altererythrobacter arenosus]|uniref:Uncharacterized protein n=1 Tax=Altererythrobacter arenosus TaxID=3032592 RepID=A0ABY8FUL9_9SPHN|nr:hypothetical protein [Altererythrobacter sp. CAU 1644]WFL78701.1 hypothetical protein P7228_06465 [Altererythrobacter sp. CAU 1644]
MKRILAPAALAISACAFASPASAQDEGGEKVNMVIVYNENECPEAVGDEIVVCEILVEADRYRIPETLRHSDNPENVAWSRRVESYKMIGAFGTMSCDPAGAGGFTGCTQQMIEAAYADRSESSKVRFGQLIAAAREDRLSTIDEDAAAEQARVEQIERAYMERLERERQGEDAVVDDQPLPSGDDGATAAEEAPADEPQG